ERSVPPASYGPLRPRNRPRPASLAGARHAAEVTSARHALGDLVDVLDLPVVALVEHFVVAALPAMVARARAREADDRAHAIRLEIGCGRRRSGVDRIAVVERDVAGSRPEVRRGWLVR